MILTKILFKRIVVEKKEDSYILISYHREKEEKNSKIQPWIFKYWRASLSIKREVAEVLGRVVQRWVKIIYS